MNDLSSAKQAIADGADVNVADLQGVTPLLIAIKNKNQGVRLPFSCFVGFCFKIPFVEN